MTVGAINWDLFACPVNVIVLVVYIIALVAMHLLRKRVYLFGWLSHYSAAVSVSVVGGRHDGSYGTYPASSFRSCSKCFNGFAGILADDCILAFRSALLLDGHCIGTDDTSCQLSLLSGRRLSFLLNHIGLFVALIAATLGNADMQRLKMTTRMGSAEWRATDDKGQLIELPLAIELKDFTIDEYPPKLMLIDNETGRTLPEKSPEHVLLEEGVIKGTLQDWQLTIEQSIPMAASVATEDTLKFTEFHSMGATYAVYLKAVNQKNQTTKEGWVSCGSFLFPYKAIRLDSLTSLVMPEREPQRFASEVKIYTQEGTITEGTIEVNRPMEIEGWKIYQLSYDETKGRWSDVSVFELVRDPWLPVRLRRNYNDDGRSCLLVRQCTKEKRGGQSMNWEYFILFAIAALVCWALGAFAAWKGTKPGWAYGFTFLGLAIFFSFIIGMWISLERPPMRTMGETRLWYSFFLPLAGLITYIRWKYKWILSFSCILSFVFICINIFKPEIHNKTLMPALQSPWFAPHVIVYMFAYAMLGAATVMAVYLLWFKKKEIERKEMDLCDNLTYVGLAFMTLGMLTGAIWAKEAWGHYWAWDPKETWAAATWFAYLAYIHFRLGKPLKARPALVILLVSFVLLQMCWYGINYLPSAQGVSVHTYNLN